MHGIAMTLHTLAAIVWVGGMFFAFIAVRPTITPLLAPAQRLPVWQGIFQRFFAWVWLAIVTLYVSGLWIIMAVHNGMAGTPLYVHVMLLLALVMTALFMFMYFKPYQQFCQAVAIGDFAVAAAHLLVMRRIIETNLALGILTTFVAVGGRYTIV